MSCNCYKAKQLPACVTNLTIGTAEPSTAYVVVFKTPTGRIDKYAATSDADGIVKVTGGKYRMGDMYEVWLAKADDIETQIPFAIGEVEVSCVNVQFLYCDDAIENQSISLL